MLARLEDAMSGSAKIINVRTQFPIAMWAIGICDFSELESYSSECIVDTCKTHKILSAAILRLRDYDPKDSKVRDVTAGLEIAHAEIVREYHRKLKILLYIADLARSQDIKILYLKGATKFLHSQRASDLRSGDDLDLLVSRPDKLQGILKELGLKSYRTTSDHEFSNVVIDGVKVDFHAYYPMIQTMHPPRAPQSRGVGNYSVSSIVEAPYTIEKLMFSQAAEGAIPLPGMPDNVFFAGALMAATITSTHAYRDFFLRSSVSARFKPLVRLGDLLEFDYFADRAGYDTFSEFKTHSGAAEMSLAWMAQLTRKMLPESGFAKSVPSPSDVSLERMRSLFGSIIYSIDNRPESLSSQPTTYEVLALFPPAKVFQLNVKGIGKKLQLDAPIIAKNALSFDLTRPEKQLLSGVEIHRRREGELVFQLNICEPDLRGRRRFQLELDGEVLEITIHRGTPEIQVKGTRDLLSQATVERTVGTEVGHILISTSLQSLFLDEGKAPVLIAGASVGERQRVEECFLLGFELEI